MSLFKKSAPDRVTVAPRRRSAVPDGLWTKCDGCGETLYTKQLEENFRVCPKCQHHFRLSVSERVKLMLDEGSFQEINADLSSVDPLRFPEYVEKALKSVQKTGLKDAMVTGFGVLDGLSVGFGASDFAFMGASMGSVYGEKVTRLIEASTQRRLPLILVVSSGGARMQEGVLSLMQLAKTSAALARFHAAGLLYVAVLTDPTTGGVTASFGMLGDLIVAEPGALIGFAGPRVIEQTIRQRLPKGFQRSEFLLEHGMIDRIIHRKDLKATLATLLRHLQSV